MKMDPDLLASREAIMHETGYLAQTDRVSVFVPYDVAA
jgi:hypothetical protein